MMTAVVLVALSIKRSPWFLVEAIGCIGLFLSARTLRNRFGKRRSFSSPEERKRAVVWNAVLIVLGIGATVASLVLGFVFGQSAFAWVVSLAALAFVSLIGIAVNVFNSPLTRGSVIE